MTSCKILKPNIKGVVKILPITDIKSVKQTKAVVFSIFYPPQVTISKILIAIITKKPANNIDIRAGGKPPKH